MLMQKIQADMLVATKASQHVKRDVLKVIMGETQMAELRQNKPMTDEQVCGVIRKAIEGNTESLGYLKPEDPRHPKLTEENVILSAYLPKMLTLDEIVTNLAPVKDQITGAKSDGQATGVAMKHLKGLQLAADGNTVTLAVKQIRTA